MIDHARTPQAATNPGESPIEIPAEMPGSVPPSEPVQPVEPDHPTIPPEASDLSEDEEAGSGPDLVDTMSQMISSGRIDMSAYRGERNDDDVERGLGPQGGEDDSSPYDE
jgi:hypothetical protein